MNEKTYNEDMKKAFLESVTGYKLIEKGDNILLGLSGGPDSLSLFYLLLSVREELSINLAAVHVNHGLRLGVCDKEQEEVESWCSKHKVPCYSVKADCQKLAEDQAISTEEMGRKLRYQAYREGKERLFDSSVTKIPNKNKIALAHHKEDQAETVLMRILRGTGPDGLAGMEHKREEGEDMVIIRPLLDFSKDDLIAYLDEEGLVAHKDMTNFQPIYQRNKIRLELLPFLEKEYNPLIVEALSRLALGAAEDKDYLGKIAKNKLEELCRKATLPWCRDQEKELISCPKEELFNLHPAIRKRLIILILEGIGLRQDYSLNHIEAIEALASRKGTGGGVSLPHGYRCEGDYDKLIFYDENTKLDSKGDVDSIKERLSLLIKPAEGLEIRSRLPGDSIPLKDGKRKKLQDYFIDEKIDKNIRDLIPLLVKDKEVIAVFGEDILGWVLELDSWPEGETASQRNETGIIRNSLKGFPKKTRMGEGYKLIFEGGFLNLEQTR